MAQFETSRRSFIKGAGLAGASTIFAGSSALAKPSVTKRRAGKARNLIFLVVDGMGTGTLSMAHYWQLRHKGTPLNWMQLYTRPGLVSALQDTASSSSPVTDSAAAGSAWGCGERVYNRSINTSDGGKARTPIWTHAREAGKSTGLVTTCRITHATSAAFAASVPHRDMEDEIADQYLERGIDVLLGGGARHFSNEARDLLPEFEKKGYQLATNAEQLRAVGKSPKVLGLFSSSHIPYAIDRENDSQLDSIPGLEVMFAGSLKSLEGAENGFVLQVEGGRVDHAGHANDVAGILREQLEFDRCIAIAEGFIERHPDTLLIVTTDHGTGGCQLNGWGEAYNDSGLALDGINGFRRSFEALGKHYQTIGQFDPQHFESMTGLQPSRGQSDTIQGMIGAGEDYSSNFMTSVFADELLARTAVGWTSNNHTAEFVELLAMGPGAREVPALMKNYELNGIIRDALGI